MPQCSIHHLSGSCTLMPHSITGISADNGSMVHVSMGQMGHIFLDESMGHGSKAFDPLTH